MKMTMLKKLKKILKASIFLLIILIGTNLTFGCGWIMYLDRGYQGTIIDADTKEPVESAVVVAVYSADCSRPIGIHTKTLGARETLTDANGAFRTPLFWAISTPDCFKSFTKFTVFKGGYGYSHDAYLFHLPINNRPPFYKVPTNYIPFDRSYDLVEDLFRKGVIIEFPRLKTTEERKKAMPHVEWELRKDMPELIKALDAEDEYLKKQASQVTVPLKPSPTPAPRFYRQGEKWYILP